MPIYEFFIEHAEKKEFFNKRILEVGSKYVNKSIRPFIERFLHPKEYIGIDIESGKFVDLVLPAEKIVEYFGTESFNVVISTETLEHVKNWRLIINNIKHVLKPNGFLYITTCSRGYPYHAYPYDYWRYEIEDMKKIFRDFKIITLKAQLNPVRVLFKAKKPENWSPINLSNIELYSMILGKRINKIPEIREMSLMRKIRLMMADNPLVGIMKRMINLT